MELQLTEDESAYFRARYRHDPVRSTEYAERTARDYVDLHAKDYLPSIRYGIFRLVVQFYMQGDPGEKSNLRVGIDALCSLGRVCHEHRAARN